MIGTILFIGVQFYLMGSCSMNGNRWLSEIERFESGVRE